MAKRHQQIQNLKLLIVAVLGLAIVVFGTSSGLFTAHGFFSQSSKTYFLAPVEDSYIQSCGEFNNYGQSDVLLIGKTENCEYTTLIRFDLTEIPKDKKIVSANLKLTRESGDVQVNLALRNLRSKWSEDSVTWSNGDVAGEYFEQVKFETGEIVATIDLTSSIESMFNENEGFSILSNGNIVSIKSAESDSPPTLEVSVL